MKEKSVEQGLNLLKVFELFTRERKVDKKESKKDKKKNEKSEEKLTSKNKNLEFHLN